MSAPEPSNREAVLAALRSLLDGARRPLVITIEDGAAPVAVLHLPPPTSSPEPAQARPQTRPDDERDCRDDILTILREAGRRLTTAQILTDITRRNWPHGESTVKRYLADMMSDGWLDNEPKERPPGYGLAKV